MVESHLGPSRYDSLLEPVFDEESGSGWMISYLDVMTLLVALFVVIIASSRNMDVPLLSASIADTPSSYRLDPTPRLAIPLPESLSEALTEARHNALPRDHQLPMAPPSLTPGAISTALGVAGRPAPRPMVVPVVLRMPPVLANVTEQPVAATDLDGARHLPDLQGVEVMRVAEGIKLRVEDRLLFPTAEADLTHSGTDLVAGMVELIQRHQGDVSVEGHTDDRPIQTPRFASNWSLSSARAIAIVQSLEQAGVAASRLRAVGLADTRPLADNATAEGRAMNRRVEVVIQLE